MPKQAQEAEAALLIWLFIEREHGTRFKARLTATRGLDPAPYRREQAATVDGVCAMVRSWLTEELDRAGPS